MIAHARQTLPPDVFWKRTRLWLEEWDRLDDEIREFSKPLGADAEHFESLVRTEPLIFRHAP